MLNILKIIQGFFKVETKEPNFERESNTSDKDLEHFLEDLSPFYMEKPIEDMGIIELFSRMKKTGDY
tara:strand:+ start:265 stop:465 length:201 start_codon:yes stop_codon:yes gene_type:complete